MVIVGAAVGLVALVIAAAQVANGALDPDDSTHAVVLRNESATPVGVRIGGPSDRSASYELPARSEVHLRPPSGFRTVRLVTFLDGDCQETGSVGFGGSEDRWSDLAMLIPMGNGSVGVLRPDELRAWRPTHEPLHPGDARSTTGCPDQ
jgi:hypothetical protein